MVDFSIFDSILDAAFILNDEGTVVYCNDAAATFCETSVRRLIGKAQLDKLVKLEAEGILPLTADSQGYHEATPFIETTYTLIKTEKSGKIQLAVRPLEDKKWFFFVRDVSLEEALHSKYRSELSQKEGYILELEEARRKLEDYSHNLEKLVEARTVELRTVNQTLKAILNSLGQGFFTFNSTGDCGRVFTKACGEILETMPEGKKVWDVLKVAPAELDVFKKWMDALFQEPLPFDDMKDLGNSMFPHSQGHHITLEYYPIRNEDGRVADVVVVATDRTVEREAQKQLEAERHFAAMVVNYIRNREQFERFLLSAKTTIESLVKTSALPINAAGVQEAFRILHTLEGESGTFCIERLRLLTRESQQILEPFKANLDMTEPARAAYQNSLMRMRNEFAAFLQENQNIFQLRENEDERMVDVPFGSIEKFLVDLEAGRPTVELHRRYVDLFLKVPISARLNFLDSLVQAVAKKIGKSVKPLAVQGGDIRIFPEPYEGLFDSFVHAVRNAVDHGIEAAEEREWAGKSPAGQITIAVAQDDAGLKIEITDDGGGIDPEAIRKKLRRSFPDKDFSNQSDDEVIQNVFMAGFSSREQIGEFSGRGVGLDALRDEALKLGGSVHVQSRPGVGTVIQIRVPEMKFEQQGVGRAA